MGDLPSLLNSGRTGGTHTRPVRLRIKIRARGFWRAFGLRARSTAGGGRPGTRMAPPQAHVSPPTRPEPPVQLVRSRFAGFSKIDQFQSLKVG